MNATPIKILHLSSERTWRGGEQQIAYLIDGLVASGVECHIGSKKGSAFSKYCKENDIEYFHLNFNNQFDFGTATTIKRYCKSHNIDLIHAHSSHSHAMAVLAATLGNKTPVVLSRRVDFPIKKNFLSEYKYNSKCVAKIICVSKAVEDIMRNDIKKPDLCVTVHDGIDLSKFERFDRNGKLHREFGLEPNCKIVANISAIAPHKDYYTFVDTVALLKDKIDNAKYFIIGTGPEEEAIRAYVHSKQLNDHIIFTGFRNDIPSIFKEIDVFLMTSKTEGLGTTLLDAMVCQVPIVATKAGGIPEIVLHEKTGLLSNIQHPEGLAQQVLRMFDDEALYATIQTQQKEYVRSFSKEETARKTLEIYQVLLEA